MGRQPSLADLEARLRHFRQERDWDQFHNLSNLASAISVEAAELLELFLWSPPVAEDEVMRRRGADVAAELADVMIQCLNFAARADIDVLEAIDRKIDENELKYPAGRSRGSAVKHSDLSDR